MLVVPYYSAPATPVIKKEKPTDWAFLVVVLLVCFSHLVFLWVSSTTFSSPPKKPSTQKLVVKTVKLNPIAPTVASVQPSLAIQQEKQGSQPKLEEKKEVKQEKTTEIVPEPPVTAPIKKEEPQPLITPPPEPIAPTPKLEPEKQKEPPPAPKPESPPIKPTTPLKSTPKPSPQPQKKPTPAPKTSPKEIKKVEPAKKQAPVAKAQPEPPKPAKPVKKEPTPEEIAAKEAEKRRELEIAAAKEAARLRQQELLEKAKENIAKIKETGDKIGTGKIVSLDSTSIPQQIGQLQIDALPVGNTVSTELSTKEINYRDEIAYRLRSALKLPDYGEIKIKLTLDRTGKVTQVQTLKAESNQNKQYIEKTVPSLIFPPFGSNFAEASHYTFLITLNNAH